MVLAMLNVFVFHVVLGGEAHSTLYYLPFGIFGFAAGNFVAWLAGSHLPMLGDVHVMEASVGAWLLLTLSSLGKKT